jgi:hypothetical protein
LRIAYCMARAALRAGFIALALTIPGVVGLSWGDAAAQTPIKERNFGVNRAGATNVPRSESDQALADGWPLYRTDRGQTAFNDAMATLKATDTAAPTANAFKGCADLACPLKLPPVTDGWVPAGRYWVSPTDYVLVVHSPRSRMGQYRRRSPREMRYFVFHEFHNGTRNIDPYDTISSHSGSVYVPFYMSKPGTDAKGHRFVVVIQVAPHDVLSTHATNYGSAGPGIEVAKNVTEQLERLQGLAGTLVALMSKEAVPQLRVVNHRGAEGQPMLQTYEGRLAAIRSRAGNASLTLPFVAASPQRVASATVARIDDLIARRGASARIPIAQRGLVQPIGVAAITAGTETPMLIEPIQPARLPKCASAGIDDPLAPCRQRTRVQ